jgi:hypothetical protein
MFGRGVNEGTRFCASLGLFARVMRRNYCSHTP